MVSLIIHLLQSCCFSRHSSRSHRRISDVFSTVKAQKVIGFGGKRQTAAIQPRSRSWHDRRSFAGYVGAGPAIGTTEEWTIGGAQARAEIVWRSARHFIPELIFNSTKAPDRHWEETAGQAKATGRRIRREKEATVRSSHGSPPKRAEEVWPTIGESRQT